ncbi:hypothetical protein H2204_004448, partial [Knufia peltigerae]
LVHHYESIIHQELSIKRVPRSLRSHASSSSSSSPSSRVRLSLQTIFGHNHSYRSTKRSGTMNSSTTTAASSVKSSPSSSFSSFGNKLRTQALESLHNNNNHSISPSLSTPNPTNLIRRQPSAIDMALEEERYADPVELIGLGLLEPRPRANTNSSVSSSPQCSMMEFMSESVQTPVVLDGIFEVMERA